MFDLVFLHTLFHGLFIPAVNEELGQELLEFPIGVRQHALLIISFSYKLLLNKKTDNQWSSDRVLLTVFLLFQYKFFSFSRFLTLVGLCTVFTPNTLIIAPTKRNIACSIQNHYNRICYLIFLFRAFDIYRISVLKVGVGALNNSSCAQIFYFLTSFSYFGSFTGFWIF